MKNDNLVAQFEAYGAWRDRLSGRIDDYRTWLAKQGLGDAQNDLRLQHLLERLQHDKLHIAFVAEFSRGKSELINAIFFGDYGQRLLPSSPGRTTMCPTELLYDEEREPCIQLLPIETRATDITITEYKRYPDEWQVVPLDMNSREAMTQAFAHVSQTKRVDRQEAARYGLFDEDDSHHLAVHEDGTVDVPRWRHAIINFPHPLLREGLVILDTPGLNAVGTEPELTLNLLPNAHAVLFLLAADTGVTKSDIEVWRSFIDGQGSQKGRIVVLNKIDTLWDELKSPQEVDREIESQAAASAKQLGLEPSRVFPVSARKGLLGKINRDDAVLAQSRLPELEHALSQELIPAKQEIVRDGSRRELDELIGTTRGLLVARLAGVREQLEELRGLRGKNQDLVTQMMDKVAQDKENFEKGLHRFLALRNIFAQQSEALLAHLGMGGLQKQVESTRQAMNDARFSKGLRDAMGQFFRVIDERLTHSTQQVDEIKRMMEMIYRKFSEEQGLGPFTMPPFSTLKYQREFSRLEKTYNDQFNTAFTMLLNEKSSLTTKFFETLASRVISVFEMAHRDAQQWLKAVIAPMETQVREHQLQLRRRLESIKRIHQATDTLEDRIAELEYMEGTVVKQLTELDLLDLHIANALALGGPEQAVAA
jgi:hypothetical protein